MTLLWMLTACGWLAPELDPLTTEPKVVHAEALWTLPTDAWMPTDLVSDGDGGLTVLDGYGGRLLRFGPDRSGPQVTPLPDLPHRPGRLAPAPVGGHWLTSATHPDAVLVGDDGAITASLKVHRGEDQPVVGLSALLDRGPDLLAATPDGALLRLDRQSGEPLQRTHADVDGASLGAPVHLSAHDDGVLLTDAFGGQIHRFDADLIATGRLARHGLWIETLASPKAAVAGPEGTVWVADSQQGVVQVFALDGPPLGALAIDGAVARWPHPVALTWAEDGVLAVLDAQTATVHGLRIPPDAVSAARASASRYRHLRTDLVTAPHHERLADGSLCQSCHDGTLLDHRQHWDDRLHHHPVHFEPRRAVPPFFPLDDAGRLRCTTCHSPHGTVTAAEAAEEAAEEERAHLVRHAPRPEDQFTRLSRQDADICIACHTDAAHSQAMEATLTPGSAHLTGTALRQALERRSGETVLGLPGDAGATCLTCHTPHSAPRPNLLRATADAELCAACHLPQSRGAHNHPVRPLDEGCHGCHEVVGGTTTGLLRSAPDGRLCTSCHEAVRGPHSKVRGAHGAGCLGCHDVHEAAATPLLARRSGGADPHACLACHGPDQRLGRRSLHPGVLGHPVARAPGDPAPACATCHNAHTPSATPGCQTCHAEQATASHRGGHGGVSCAQCHPAHRAPPTSLSAVGVNPRSARCLGCHGPEAPPGTRRVAAWDHPAPVFTLEGARWTPLASLPLFDADGEPVAPTRSGDLTCGSCHTTHGPPPGGGALLRPGVVQACASCHGSDAERLHRGFHMLTGRR